VIPASGWSTLLPRGQHWNPFHSTLHALTPNSVFGQATGSSVYSSPFASMVIPAFKSHWGLDTATLLLSSLLWIAFTQAPAGPMPSIPISKLGISLPRRTWSLGSGQLAVAPCCPLAVSSGGIPQSPSSADWYVGSPAYVPGMAPHQHGEQIFSNRINEIFDVTMDNTSGGYVVNILYVHWTLPQKEIPPFWRIDVPSSPALSWSYQPRIPVFRNLRFDRSRIRVSLITTSGSPHCRALSPPIHHGLSLPTVGEVHRVVPYVLPGHTGRAVHSLIFSLPSQLSAYASRDGV